MTQVQTELHVVLRFFSRTWEVRHFVRQLSGAILDWKSDLNGCLNQSLEKQAPPRFLGQSRHMDDARTHHRPLDHARGVACHCPVRGFPPARRCTKFCTQLRSRDTSTFDVWCSETVLEILYPASVVVRFHPVVVWFGLHQGASFDLAGKHWCKGAFFFCASVHTGTKESVVVCHCRDLARRHLTFSFPLGHLGVPVGFFFHVSLRAEAVARGFCRGTRPCWVRGVLLYLIMIPS